MPEKVPWLQVSFLERMLKIDIVVLLQVANTLNMKFKASCGRQLTEENLKFLAGKAFRWVFTHFDQGGSIFSVEDILIG